MQKQRFDAFERSLSRNAERALLRNFKSAYDETVAQMASLYAKVGQADGTIRKEDAIRYNQLNNRLANIATEMKKLRDKGIKLTEETSTQAIQDAYYGGQWAFEQSVGVPLPIPALPVAAIRRAVADDISGLDYKQRWGKNISGSQLKVQETIVRGLTQGYSYQKMARAIKANFNSGLSDAIRVVRTEAGRCWSEGAEASHEAAVEAGLNVRKRWSASTDTRTRADHAMLDGKYADEDGLFWAGGASAKQPRTFGVPEQDINCRCAVYDVLDGFEPNVRRIRGETGEDGYSSDNAQSRIVPYQTFEQWARPKGWTPEKGWPRVGKA